MELKELTNNQKRKEWLESYNDWPVWFTVKEAAATSVGIQNLTLYNIIG